MISAHTVRALATILVGILAMSSDAGAQATCPFASGEDAEAGWAAYTANDMAAARTRFGSALARCPDDQYSRTGLGYVELREGEEAEAERLWNAVVSVEPDNVDALVGLGLAQWRAGDLGAVEASFSRVLELSPGHPTAVEYMDRLSENGGGTAAADAADDAWASGDTELALQLYLDRLANDGDDPVSLLRVALIRAWDERYTEAIGLLDQLLEVHPTDLDARLARARVRAWSGDIPGAQDEVAEVLAVQPDNTDALEALALFLAWSGQFDEAVSTYDDVLSIAPTGSPAERQRAQALAWSGRFQASRTAYDALIARDPDDVDARLGLATTLAFGGDFNGAVIQYDEVLARRPAEIRALIGKSKTLGWAGRLAEAEEVALSAVEVDLESADAWAGLGQMYRWQGRNAAALEALETAAGLAPTNAEIRDQLRSLNLTFAPLARPSFVLEDDSDGNRMLSTLLMGTWHPVPRLEVRAEAYYRRLEQDLQAFGTLERSAQGLTVSGTYQFDPGWTVSGGLGGSITDGVGDPSFAAFQAGLRTPEKHPVVGALSFSASAQDGTALLAERGVKSTEVLLAGRWAPSPGWRVDGSFGLGAFNGSEKNGRRSASLAASRRVGRFFSLGASFRGFSFEKNLSDGYFDPDVYAIGELTSYWLYRLAPWTFLVELAPGLQKVTRDGDLDGAIRSNTRVGYEVEPGREVSLSFGYSSAGLVGFATRGSDYSYTALILGFNWIF
jgi:tetratricopeptide (TPR) repeat protein